ncbi:MAG TPA: FAD-dependent oxidoreductase [Polyangiaceae bacterium]|nr:FAD-dependent oxidoreductase [Polyangiaceae bacterium]
MPDEPGLYVIGSFEERVTIYSQQVRALNLVYSLAERRKLGPGKRVAMVGGGVAGLTAAAAALQLGATVTLLEKRSQLLPLLEGDTKRWLHPRLYDWPEEEATQAHAELPVMTWRAQTAPEVRRQLEKAWKKSFAKHPGMTPLLNIEHVSVPLHQTPPRPVEWHAVGSKREVFDAVLLAVGFGIERKLEGIDTPEYWRSDKLDELNLDKRVTRYLVSGCGDGGLIDLLRVRVERFRHERILEDFGLKDISGALRDRLLQIDQEAHEERKAGKDPAPHLNASYREIDVPAAVDRALLARARKDTTAMLNGDGAYPLRLESAILSRLLASRLLFSPTLEKKAKVVQYHPGRIKPEQRADGLYVKFSDNYASTFDEIVARHGPEPSFAQDFEPIYRQHQKILREHARQDLTRTPIWPPGFSWTAPVSPAGSIAIATGRTPPSASAPAAAFAYAAAAAPTAAKPARPLDAGDPPPPPWVKPLFVALRERQNAWVSVLPESGFDALPELLRREMDRTATYRLDLASVEGAEHCLRTLADFTGHPKQSPITDHVLVKKLLSHQHASRLVLLLSGWGLHAHLYGHKSLMSIAVRLAKLRNVQQDVVLAVESPTPPRHLIPGHNEGSLLNLTVVSCTRDQVSRWIEAWLKLPPAEVSALLTAADGHIGALLRICAMRHSNASERTEMLTRYQEQIGEKIRAAVGPCCAEVLSAVAAKHKRIPRLKCRGVLQDAGILIAPAAGSGGLAPRVEAWAKAWLAPRGGRP